MLKKILCMVVIGSIAIVTSGRTALAASVNAKEAAQTEKVKAAILKLGTGPSARVEITLHDKSKLKGFIKEANDEHFVLVHTTGYATDVAYPQVRQVKGNNLSTGAKVAIGVGVGIAILILIFKDHIMAY
jgi:hypothetical protein